MRGRLCFFPSKKKVKKKKTSSSKLTPPSPASPSHSDLAPNTKNSATAAQCVHFFEISAGAAHPRKADSAVIVASAPIAPAKTSFCGCFIAMMAAMKKVLSPISETRIMPQDLRKPCFGWGREREMVEGGG